MPRCFDTQLIAEQNRLKAAQWLNGTSDNLFVTSSENIKPVVMFNRHKSANVDRYIQVEPAPLVSLVSQNEARRFASVKYNAEVDDRSIRGISRIEYSYQDILNVQSWLIGAILDPMTGELTQNGRPYTRVSIIEGSGTTWDLIVRLKVKR